MIDWEVTGKSGENEKVTHRCERMVPIFLDGKIIIVKRPVVLVSSRKRRDKCPR
jgi:hypothetical protein